ncbi:ABC-type transport system involved in resistance to organic solvents auxiliary component [Paramagnetospirillum magnetotacticum MS-1]|uniref:ABC-type transport system involved in resistance to organic solvents auxiliary component n=1 Tax=Paramagnetospirillum magnetotacticum MS-1 TaxID=272627 RepID=A0A0C2V254_PARME|nr:ABC transporter substrate-binding protein [Paramagnetospirillum magnetotacticum]KIL99141.1 ABC-type transport system involved in resistance to organic solvents auxiliary component [Paramagnetospirillum magnetotacticum MS-1]
MAMTLLRRSALAVVLILGVFLTPGTAGAADVEQGRKTVQSAVNEGISTFVGKTHPLPERTRLLDDLLRRYVDPSMLSASILGRYWGKISESEQKAFSQLFVHYLVTSYVGILGRAEPGTLVKVTGGVDQGSTVKVQSSALLPSQPGDPIPVEWIVATTAEGKPVIMDLSAQGVSLIRAMKDDFASVLRGSGGKIEPLMDALKRKIESNEKENATLHG